MNQTKGKKKKKKRKEKKIAPDQSCYWEKQRSHSIIMMQALLMLVVLQQSWVEQAIQSLPPSLPFPRLKTGVDSVSLFSPLLLFKRRRLPFVLLFPSIRCQVRVGSPLPSIPFRPTATPSQRCYPMSFESCIALPHPHLFFFVLFSPG
ncbi:uncharacterized protein BO66DRAFT_239569 [Aspergillus aculeatinus CBS 121060]|uniref:Uncharacterized protein n=1 Tax=Aspergillus aculeatinus CBS 121060 TaxID=1448322 RepID=A0ACD1HIJ6_9EURO|nr:hypothetical protein BO66DRAFT_239569 [Aspergillus aculeatinus CBS 121060]RAH73307.1 hypothetical protein BO66DRAFT_239569 [Aspergillus aculeatinus CBS 121060]